MNRYDTFVADPEWGHYIIWYFFLGGIAAGAYAVACMVRLVGDEDDRKAVRVADYLATPLIAICGLLLVIDLGRPERFWHMLIQSNTYRPMLKWWSPMSAGSWALSSFGAFSGISFLASLAEDGWFGLGRFRWLADRLTRGPVGVLVSLGGLVSAFFLGAYTGTLLTATNQPVWAQTTWLSPLFLASAASTGVAAMILMVRWRLRETPHAVVDRLERVDAIAMVLELLMLVAFALSLGDLAGPAMLRWPGVLIPAFVVPAGLLIPLASRRLPGAWWRWASPVLVLVSGFALRYAMVHIPATFRMGA
ncbi:NrfD/PsrC family molybdoenzyme membrane anchor subunit [Tundrisphaera lichenicola]|uniref:NrfD/PsrC family molybdoenzyme membrane anchor subunit n=1 Tax=Tundrisphaera lichenicola TaxID=2029860 RepID=UPI003EBFECBF